MLCYILKTVEAPISKSNLEILFQTTELANYFEVGAAIVSLLENGLIKSEKGDNNEDFYTVTKEGIDVADNLDTELPMSTRKKAVSAALEILAKEKSKCNTHTEIEKLERGFNVKLSITDGETLMMQTVLYAADGLQANIICENFSSDPTKLYSGIIETLTR